MGGTWVMGGTWSSSWIHICGVVVIGDGPCHWCDTCDVSLPAPLVASTGVPSSRYQGRGYQGRMHPGHGVMDKGVARGSAAQINGRGGRRRHRWGEGAVTKEGTSLTSHVHTFGGGCGCGNGVGENEGQGETLRAALAAGGAMASA